MLTCWYTLVKPCSRFVSDPSGPNFSYLVAFQTLSTRSSYFESLKHWKAPAELKT